MSSGAWEAEYMAARLPDNHKGEQMGKQALICSVMATSLKFDMNVEAEREIDRGAAIGLTARANPLGANLNHAEAEDTDSCRHAAQLVAGLIIKRYRIARSAAEKIALARTVANGGARLRHGTGEASSLREQAQAHPFM
jgi:hypothetical protein